MPEENSEGAVFFKDVAKNTAEQAATAVEGFLSRASANVGIFTADRNANK